MMKYRWFVRAAVLAAVVGAGAPAKAQQGNPRFEVGATYGWEDLSRRGPDVTAGGFQSIAGRGGYLGLFLTPRVLFTVSPGVAFGGNSGTTVEVGSELKYLFRGPNQAGPYASLGLAASSGGSTVVHGGEWAAGLGLGYRMPVTDRITLQAGLMHQRWFHDRVGQTGLTLGVGFRLGSRR